jgi:hypothetical protein
MILLPISDSLECQDQDDPPLGEKKLQVSQVRRDVQQDYGCVALAAARVLWAISSFEPRTKSKRLHVEIPIDYPHENRQSSLRSWGLDEALSRVIGKTSKRALPFQIQRASARACPERLSPGKPF